MKLAGAYVKFTPNIMHTIRVVLRFEVVCFISRFIFQNLLALRKICYQWYRINPGVCGSPHHTSPSWTRNITPTKQKTHDSHFAKIDALCFDHNSDVIMDAIASQITSLTIVYSTVYSGADQIKHQSSASLAFVWGIHRRSVNSPHKWPVSRKMFLFDDVIM